VLSKLLAAAATVAALFGLATVAQAGAPVRTPNGKGFLVLQFKVSPPRAGSGVAVEFARTPTEVEAALVKGARFVLVDLTAGRDYDRILKAAEVARVPVLGFTTHALARATQPWHARCRRVVTKETLTQELPALLREGVGA